MKIRFLLLTFLAIIPIHDTVRAASSCTKMPQSCDQYPMAYQVYPCGDSGGGVGGVADSSVCYRVPSTGQIAMFVNCSVCDSDMTRKQVRISDAEPECTNSDYVWACCSTCSASNCASDTSFTSNGYGVEYKTIRACGGTSQCAGECQEIETQYRCSAGYYGTDGNCSRCPQYGSVYGSSATGSTSITNCYLPAGTGFSDTTGSGQFTQDCSYSS